MKVLRERINRRGKREAVIELDAGEHIMAINPDTYYKTGYPLEDVIQGHIMLDSKDVTWCPIGQEWVQ